MSNQDRALSSGELEEKYLQSLNCTLDSIILANEKLKECSINSFPTFAAGLMNITQAHENLTHIKESDSLQVSTLKEWLLQEIKGIQERIDNTTFRYFSDKKPTYEMLEILTRSYKNLNN